MCSKSNDGQAALFLCVFVAFELMILGGGISRHAEASYIYVMFGIHIYWPVCLSTSLESSRSPFLLPPSGFCRRGGLPVMGSRQV